VPWPPHRCTVSQISDVLSPVLCLVNCTPQVSPLYRDEPGVEMEYVVGPVPNGKDTQNIVSTHGDQKDIVKQFPSGAVRDGGGLLCGMPMGGSP